MKFGARVTVPRHAQKLRRSASRFGFYEVTRHDGAVLEARTVVIASGPRYRKLRVPEEDRLQGLGLYYAATELEARVVTGQEVVVVGGGNSAGQAAMFLATRASQVRLVHRRSDLSESMSQYLVDRLRRAANVKIEMRSQVVELLGDDDRLRSVKIRDGEGRVVERPVGGLLVMVGADPCSRRRNCTVRPANRR